MININKLENSLIVYDNMNSAIQQVNNNLSLTMNNTKNFINFISIDIGSINNNFNTYSESLNDLSKAQDKAAKGQKNVNDSLEKSSNPVKRLLGKVKDLVSGFLSFDNLKAGIKLSIEGAAKAEQDLFNIQTAIGNKEVGKAYFDNLKKHANSSAFAFDDFASNARNFMEITKNTNSLDKLGNLSERLTLNNPNQGLQGAGDSLKEAMSGNFSSLKDKFGFNEVDTEILKASKSTEDFIGKFDILLNKKGLTEERLAEYNRLPMPQMDQLKENYNSSLAEIGEAGLQALMPLMIRLNEAFSSDSFQGLISILSGGLSTIINLGLGVADIFISIINVIQGSWSIVQPILISIIIFLGGMLIQALWGVIQSLLNMAVAWIASHFTIVFIIGLMTFLISLLLQYGITAEQILGFVGGLFGVLYATVYNIIALIWNRFAALAEFLINVFIDPAYAINKLFYDIAMNFYTWIGNIAKGLTDLINKIPGVKIDLYSGIENLKASLELKKPTTDKNVIKIARMEQMDYTEAAASGYKKGAEFGNKLSNLVGNFNNSDTLLKDWNMQQTDNFNMGNDKLDKVNDNIGISNENLQFLRDLAEQESIQNFVTLTPTVQVTTGDIKEEADINKIITKIETYMQNELAIQAEGVYA